MAETFRLTTATSWYVKCVFVMILNLKFVGVIIVNIVVYLCVWFFVAYMDEQMMGPGGPMPMRPMGPGGPRPLLADPGHPMRMRGPGLGPGDEENYDYDGPHGPMMMDGPRGPGPRMMMPDGPRPLIGDGPRGPMHGPHGMRPNMMRGPGPGPIRPLFGQEGPPDDDYENGDGQMIPGFGPPDDGNMGGPGNMPVRGIADMSLVVSLHLLNVAM